MSGSRVHHLLIALILLAGAGLRVLAFSPYTIHHPDEAIQYIEQAYRLSLGAGLVPWESRLGMRSWVVPLLLAGPMRLGEAMAPGSLLYIVLPRAAAASVASTSVVAAYVIGRRVSPAHGLVAMAVMALWYESVYFSVHVVTESLSVAAFLCAAALLGSGAARSRLVAGGALLTFAAIFRIQYGPAVAAFAIVLFGTRRRDWAWLTLGGLAAGVAGAIVDLVMGEPPFRWAYNNVYQNVIADKASSFGRYGAAAYPQMLWLHWQAALVPILWLALRAARRHPALGAAAAVNLAVHLLIGHKEWRFILLSGQIAILLAAIGSVDMADRLKAGWGKRARSRPVLLTGLMAAWGAVSLLLAFSGASDPGWRRFEGGFRLAREARQRHACGVALLGGSYWATGGQSYLRDVPLYSLPARDEATSRGQIASTGHAYDAIIAPPDSPVAAAYRRLACRGEMPDRLCLAMRPGGCPRDAGSDRQLMQRVMERSGR